MRGWPAIRPVTLDSLGNAVCGNRVEGEVASVLRLAAVAFWDEIDGVAAAHFRE